MIEITPQIEREAAEYFDEVRDNFLTGNIHLISDYSLFELIEKRGLGPLEECSVLEVKKRWDRHINRKRNPF